MHMKITDIVGRHQGPKKVAESSHQIDITVAVSTDDAPIANIAVRELVNLLLDLGPDLSKYMGADELALMERIARFGIQDNAYCPTPAVESFARYLQARCELSRALA
jgi:hypothetical protein